MFLAIAVDNLANAQELTAAEEEASAEAAELVCVAEVMVMALSCQCYLER